MGLEAVGRVSSTVHSELKPKSIDLVYVQSLFPEVIPMSFPNYTSRFKLRIQLVHLDHVHHGPCKSFIQKKHAIRIYILVKDSRIQECQGSQIIELIGDMTQTK